MTKQQFLSELQSKLSGLPQQDLEERINFYDEMIDDRMEEGLTEDKAVDEIGSVDDVVSQILSDYPLSKIVREKVKPRRNMKAWEIVLLVFGSPIWISLLISAFAVVLSLYITVWAVVISLWAAAVSIAVCALYSIVMAVVYAFQGNLPAGAALLGLSLFCAGAAILSFFGCMALSKGVVILTKKMFFSIKKLFIGKETDK